MQSSLLATKLYFPPTRPNLVPRPRLVSRLQAGLQGALTLVSAPAGSGKTVLLTEWHAGVGARMPAAWLALEEADNDPVRFFEYLCTALDKLQPSLAEQTLPGMLIPDNPNLEALLTTAINTLLEMEQDSALILDDYHLIHEAEIHNAITFLLNHLPPRLHLVLLTRSDPSLPLSRLRAHGRLTEIRAEHLRFDQEETAQFLNEVMGLALAPQQIAALEARTEGWIAGLQLAALSMRGRQNTDTFIQAFTGSHRYIVDYLVEDVLNRQDEPVRDFLLKTSILERLTGELCSALTGCGDGQAMLEKLAASNLFLISLDDQRIWYRYHHLFRDLLLNRLHNRMGAQETNLHRHAAAWFEAQRITIEAVEHFFAAGDYAQIRHVLRQDYPHWLRAVNRARLMSWFERLPRPFLRKDPWLCMVFAWVVWNQGDILRTEGCLDDAQAALDDPEPDTYLPADDPEYVYMPSEILSLRALIANQKQDLTSAVELANSALKGLNGSTAPEACIIRGIADLTLQNAYRETGQMEEAIKVCTRALAESQAGGETGTIVSATHSLGVTHLIQGRLHQAAQVYQEGLHQAEHAGNDRLPAYGLLMMRLAEIYYQWNKLDEAENLLRAGLERSETGGYPWAIFFGRNLSAIIHLARGNMQAAQTIMSDLVLRMQKNAVAYYKNELMIYLAVTLARLGMEELASTWLARVPEELTVEPRTLEIDQMLRRQQALRFLGGAEPSESMIAQIAEVTARRGNLFWQIEALALQAVVLFRKKDLVNALACLQKALTLAEPEGIQRVFLDQGAPMLELLHSAQARGIHPSHTARLLAALRAKTNPEAGKIDTPAPVPLSKRELELMKLIAAGRSNKEIAMELYISIGTVKRHTVNIFTKLDVKNRTEAVSRARELGLI
jgi:LuxR family maltose regulon positive regulatory protein